MDSKEKPGDTEPTGMQEEKQKQGYDNKVIVYVRPAESKNNQNTMMTPPDESPAAETVRGPAELEEGEFDDAETRNEDGASIRTKEVTQSKKPSAHGQVTSANQKKKVKEKEAEKKANEAKTGKEQRFQPTGKPTSSKNANANPQKPKEVSPYNSTTPKGAGNKYAPVGNVQLFTVLAATLFFSVGIAYSPALSFCKRTLIYTMHAIENTTNQNTGKPLYIRQYYIQPSHRALRSYSRRNLVWILFD